MAGEFARWMTLPRSLRLGATRIVLGTVAMRQPEIVGDAVREFGADAIVVALDARDGYVAVEGWQTATTVEASHAATMMRELGVTRLLFTDVARDGMLSGPNIEATEALARGSGLGVIASGGVATLDQVAALAQRAAAGIRGAIIGQALYAGEMIVARRASCSKKRLLPDGFRAESDWRLKKMLAKRIIPCLDVKDGRVVKGVNFVSLRDAGDPVEQAQVYDREGADELVFLDITASHERRDIVIEMVRRVADTVFIPFTVGGGIRTADDIRELLMAGADKVSINSTAVTHPEVITAGATRFGSQCIVVAIDGEIGRATAGRCSSTGGGYPRDMKWWRGPGRWKAWARGRFC